MSQADRLATQIAGIIDSMCGEVTMATRRQVRARVQAHLDRWHVVRGSDLYHRFDCAAKAKPSNVRYGRGNRQPCPDCHPEERAR